MLKVVGGDGNLVEISKPSLALNYVEIPLRGSSPTWTIQIKEKGVLERRDKIKRQLIVAAYIRGFYLKDYSTVFSQPLTKSRYS